MIDKTYIDYLKILHGSYNTIVALLFVYQGAMGRKIRRERKAGGKRDFGIIRRHRKTGPLIVQLGILGYFIGAVLVYIDKGRLLEYPFHLMTGSLLVLCIIASFILSRRIRGTEADWRTPHLLVGIIILLLYLIQIVSGLNLLL